MSNSVSISTFLQLSSNMVTTSELRQYMIAAYGRQVNGEEFTATQVAHWVRRRQVPEVYGGHKILEAKLVQPFRVTVLTLTDFDRSILEDLEVLKKTAQGPKVQLPRKQRTRLYYQILGSRNTTKKTLKAATLPDKSTGVKANQRVREKKRKPKNP